jgi:murein DD-endopeptidase MepM/ murein hydrolase activator NlpD
MLELQYHPADIRKPSRYLFLRARTVRLLIVGGSMLALLVTVALMEAPRGVAGLVLWGRTVHLAERTAAERAEVEQHLATLEALHKRFEEASVLEAQMELIFGAPEGESFAGGAAARGFTEAGVADPNVAVGRADAMVQESADLLDDLSRLAAFVAERRALVEAVPSVCPLPAGSFVLTSPFGSRISPFTGQADFHAGIDLAAREGVPVQASGAGVVTFRGRFPLKKNVAWWRLGNVVAINHDDRYLTIYAHLQSIAVERGERVRRGRTVGTVGSTGWSTSPHLHYEVRLLDRSSGAQVPMDPRIFILDHDWQGREAMLIASRAAPAPPAEALPFAVKVR